MEFILNTEEARVLGSLIEKELTTPEYYPLTLNALTNACNQKTNRDPVVSYDEQTVVAAVESLREKGLSRLVTGGSSRVFKYKHCFSEALELQSAEIAVLCVLLLRGAQTIGEIRGRTERMHFFTELSDAQQVLDNLISRTPKPLIIRLPRQAGQKDIRFMHLLCGEPDLSELAILHSATQKKENTPAQIERFESIEKQVSLLADELKSLRKQFESFKKQFE